MGLHKDIVINHSDLVLLILLYIDPRYEDYHVISKLTDEPNVSHQFDSQYRNRFPDTHTEIYT